VLLRAWGRSRGVLMTGIDPDAHRGINELHARMVAGSDASLVETPFSVVIGATLSQLLGIQVGDSVDVTLPKVTVTPLGVFPRERALEVVGIFEVGADPDANQIYVSLDTARRLLVREGVDAIELRLTSPDAVTEVIPAVAARLPPGFRVVDWRSSQGSLFSAVRMEKITVSLLLLSVVAVAAFNIISTLTMAVTEKRGDIAVLRVMGAPAGDILRIFLGYGLLLGVIGIATGAVLGVLLALSVSDLAAAIDADDTVVDPDRDRTVVPEDGIGDAGEARARLDVVDHLRPLGEVAAGHDQDLVPALEEQVMQRRIRQHRADPVLARGDRRCDRVARPRPQQDDGRARALEESRFGRRDDAVPGQARKRAGHHRERLVRPPLARPQPAHGRIVTRRAGKVIAADALDGDRTAGVDQGPECIRDRPPSLQHGAVGKALEPERGAARGAGVGLGVEPAIGRVLVLALAHGAHGKARHGRLRAVVRRAFEDGKARPAVGAVGERVAKAAIARIPDLAEAARTGRKVGADAE